MTPPSDTSSKKTHDRDFEEKSRDKWFKRTSHNLKNLFKFKTKEKNLEKDNTKRHSPEKSANQNEGSQVLSPSSTKESLQSKMPTIQELSTSSSPSTSPRKSYPSFLCHLGMKKIISLWISHSHIQTVFCCFVDHVLRKTR
jgi:hypothetical protein